MDNNMNKEYSEYANAGRRLSSFLTIIALFDFIVVGAYLLWSVWQMGNS